MPIALSYKQPISSSVYSPALCDESSASELVLQFTAWHETKKMDERSLGRRRVQKTVAVTKSVYSCPEAYSESHCLDIYSFKKKKKHLTASQTHQRSQDEISHLFNNWFICIIEFFNLIGQKVRTDINAPINILTSLLIIKCVMVNMVISSQEDGQR